MATTTAASHAGAFGLIGEYLEVARKLEAETRAYRKLGGASGMNYDGYVDALAELRSCYKRIESFARDGRRSTEGTLKRL